MLNLQQTVSRDDGVIAGGVLLHLGMVACPAALLMTRVSWGFPLAYAHFLNTSRFVFHCILTVHQLCVFFFGTSINSSGGLITANVGTANVVLVGGADGFTAANVT